MARTPNEALRQRSRRSNLASARALELRELHPLIAGHIEKLSTRPSSIIGSGISDYLDPTQLCNMDAVFRRYRNVNPVDISSRNLTRIIQFAVASSMDFHKDTFFDEQSRRTVFGVIKAAAILQAGHYLGSRYRKLPVKPRNRPTANEIKQKSVERFAVRWLDLSLNPQTPFLPISDRQTLLDTFDSVNAISNGDLGALVKKSLISDLPSADVRPPHLDNSAPHIVRSRIFGFFDRKQIPNNFD